MKSDKCKVLYQSLFFPFFFLLFLLVFSYSCPHFLPLLSPNLPPSLLPHSTPLLSLSMGPLYIFLDLTLPFLSSSREIQFCPFHRHFGFGLFFSDYWYQSFSSPSGNTFKVINSINIHIEWCQEMPWSGSWLTKQIQFIISFIVVWFPWSQKWKHIPSVLYFWM